MFHVTAFSLVGQLRIRRSELLNYRELYVERVAQRDEAGELPGPEEARNKKKKRHARMRKSTQRRQHAAPRHAARQHCNV